MERESICSAPLTWREDGKSRKIHHCHELLLVTVA